MFSYCRSTKGLSLGEGTVDDFVDATAVAMTTLAVSPADAATGIADAENDIADGDEEKDDDEFLCVELRFPYLSGRYNNLVRLAIYMHCICLA